MVSSWCTSWARVYVQILRRQVHEMGAMLIYFQPAFYCNVNDAWTFATSRAAW